MIRNKTTLSVLTAAMTLALVGHAQAATIVPVDYFYTSPTPTGNAGVDPGDRLNDDVISTGSWNDGANISFGVGSIPANQTQARVTFDLGAVYQLSEIVIYQNEVSNWGADRVEVFTSTDNVTFTSGTSFDLVGATNIGASTRGYTLDASGLADAQYVQIDFFEGNQWIMLTEFDFSGTIPEPASLALLSLGGLLVAGRQRRA